MYELVSVLCSWCVLYVANVDVFSFAITSSFFSICFFCEMHMIIRIWNAAKLLLMVVSFSSIYSKIAFSILCWYCCCRFYCLSQFFFWFRVVFSLSCSLIHIFSFILYCRLSNIRYFILPVWLTSAGLPSVFAFEVCVCLFFAFVYALIFAISLFLYNFICLPSRTLVFYFSLIYFLPSKNFFLVRSFVSFFIAFVFQWLKRKKKSEKSLCFVCLQH